MDDKRQVIAKAADIIEEKGWCQKKMVDDNGCVCAFKAVRLAARDLFPKDGRREDVAVLEARNFVSEQVGSTMVNWNDGKLQTKDNVIEVLRQIAAS